MSIIFISAHKHIPLSFNSSATASFVPSLVRSVALLPFPSTKEEKLIEVLHAYQHANNHFDSSPSLLISFLELSSPILWEFTI